MKKYYFIILFLTLFTGTVLAQDSKSSVLKSKVVLAQEIEQLQIFPNPVTEGKVQITTKNNHTKSIWIYDVLGNMVLQTKLYNRFLDVSHLKSGVYIINISERDRRSSRRLVIR
ncbi:MAG: T9SS type A sorting domain-containing protein [Flavobacteriaceae bacterium]|nr:T9SS type A sorting domain-containing protein [Flavobacteriaceae bacterium]